MSKIMNKSYKRKSNKWEEMCVSGHWGHARI